MSVGKKLRSLRQKAKKTLKEQSEIFDVKLNTVYRWEHDQTKPNMLMLEKIAKYYDVTLDWLLHDGSDDGQSEYENNASYPMNNIEQRIIKMLRKLPENEKYRILGYMDHIYVETHK